MKDYLNKICWLTNQKKQPKSILRHCLYQAMNVWMGLINKLKLAVSIVSDYSRYKCDIDKIIFRPTIMFGSHSYKIELKNIRAIAHYYSIKLLIQTQAFRIVGRFRYTQSSSCRRFVTSIASIASVFSSIASSSISNWSIFDQKILIFYYFIKLICFTLKLFILKFY